MSTTTRRRRSEVPYTPFEYAHASEASPHEAHKRAFTYWHVRDTTRGKYVTGEWYNPTWDLGSRNGQPTLEDLHALGFDANDDEMDQWADDCEPWIVPARHRNDAEWERLAEIPAPPPEAEMPDDVTSWVLDHDAVLHLARLELSTGQWVRGAAVLRRRMGWTPAQFKAAIGGYVALSTETVQRMADMLNTSVTVIAVPWNEKRAPTEADALF